MGIFAICDFGKASNHTFDEYILRIFETQQRFFAFVFLDVEICQIAWFGGCKSSIGIERPIHVVFPN